MRLEREDVVGHRTMHDGPKPFQKEVHGSRLLNLIEDTAAAVVPIQR